MPTDNQVIDRAIRRRLIFAGYSKIDVARGLAYAREQAGEYSIPEGFELALSRILYSDQQLADGARFSALPSNEETIPEWSVDPWHDTDGGGGIMASHKSGKTLRVEVPFTATAVEIVAALRELASLILEA